MIFRLSRPVPCKNQENGSGKWWSLGAPETLTEINKVICPFLWDNSPDLVPREQATRPLLSFWENRSCLSQLIKKLNSTERGARFWHFCISKVIITAHAHKSGVIFHIFPRAFKPKKNKALRPKMTKIASRGPALNSILRERVNFRRRPFLCTTLHRNLMQASNFGGTFDQLFLWIFFSPFLFRYVQGKR